MNLNDIFLIQKYIDENLENDISLKELCDYAGYSEFHFIRLFKRKLNVTPMEYVVKRRLIKASEDILNGDKIIDVAMKYNWQSHGGFSKAFKKEFGFHPSFLKAMIYEIGQMGGSAMSYVFLNVSKVGAGKEELFESLKEKLIENKIAISENEVNEAYICACKMYADVFRYSGEEYVTHTLNVAMILADLEADENVILAGLFCDAYKKGTIKIEDIKSKLSREVYCIVEKIGSFGNGSWELDDEVAAIKLAERLHNMRTIDYIDSDKKRIKAKETLDKYMPIARNLNNSKLINELNDLSLKYCM